MTRLSGSVATVFLALALAGQVAGAAAAGAERDIWTEKLRSGDRSERLVAVRTLLERGTEAREAFPVLVEVLAEDETLDTAVAAETLFSRPREAKDITPLLRALELETKGRAAAAWEISRVGPLHSTEVESVLRAALAHPDKHERNFIVLALAMTGVHAKDTVLTLEKILRDPGVEDPPQLNYKYPRAMAALALGLAGPVAQPSIPALRDGLKEKGGWESQIAANRLALEMLADRTNERPAADVASLDDLRRKLRAGPSRINPRLVAGLRMLGEFAATAKPIMKPGARRGAPAVHESVSLAIGYLDSLPQAPSPNEIVAQDKAGALTPAIRMHVMALGGMQQGIAQVLIEAITRGRENPRVAAARELGAIGPAAKPAQEDLRAALGDPDWILRREAFLALERIEGGAPGR